MAGNAIKTAAVALMIILVFVAIVITLNYPGTLAWRVSYPTSYYAAVLPTVSNCAQTMSNNSPNITQSQDCTPVTPFVPQYQQTYYYTGGYYYGPGYFASQPMGNL
ncbi:MAG: hypothetical protein WC246_01000 [Candidatus Paceibacterota bacterium]